MNPVEKALRKVDATQRRFTPTAFVFGVIKKYGDDNGGVLASNLAYSSFVSLFPLLLILVTILGLIAAHDPSFRESAVKDAVANQIPLLGQALTSNVNALQRSSTIGLIVGLVVLIYGVTGLAQAGLFTMEQVWNLPGPARPGYVQRLGRAVLFLGLLGAGAGFGDGCWTLGPPGGTGPPGPSGASGSLGRTGSETPSPPTGLTGVCGPSPRGGNGTICPRGRPAWLPRSRERAVTVSLRSHRRRRMARSTSLAASFLARSCLLSYVRLPRASASSTLTLPSLK